MYVETIRVQELSQYSTDPNTIIIDLRRKSEYEKAHIPNSISIPYDEIDDHKELFEHWNRVIFYCARGNLSLLAAREFSKTCKGHFISVGGGFNAYKQCHQMERTISSN